MIKRIFAGLATGLIITACGSGFAGEPARAGADRIKVGFYDDVRGEGISIEVFQRYFDQRRGYLIEGFTSSDISTRAIDNYDVLVFAAGGGRERFGWLVDSTRRYNLGRYCAKGGGVLLSWFPTGRITGKTRLLFPEVGYGSGKTAGRLVKIVDQHHSLTKGLKESFLHGYSEEVSIVPGQKGKVIALNSAGDPILVVGEHHSGKVAFYGSYIYDLKAQNNPEGTDGILAEEANLVDNVLKWLSSGKKDGRWGKEMENDYRLSFQQTERIMDEMNQDPRLDDKRGLLVITYDDALQQIDGYRSRSEQYREMVGADGMTSFVGKLDQARRDLAQRKERLFAERNRYLKGLDLQELDLLRAKTYPYPTRMNVAVDFPFRKRFKEVLGGVVGRVSEEWNAEYSPAVIRRCVKSTGKRLKAGVAQVDITPPVGTVLHGYSPRKSTGIHDRLYAQALILDNGEERVCIIACDNVGPGGPRLRKAVEEAIGLPASNVFVCASHTHSAGGALTRDMTSELVTTALNNIKEAKVGIGKGRIEGISCGQMERGTSFNRMERGGLIDPEIGVICITDLSGERMATLVNFACHPVVLGPSNTLTSADFPHYLRKAVKKSESEIVIFTNGAAGDINPLPSRLLQKGTTYGDFKEAERMGSILAKKASEVIASLQFSAECDLRVAQQEVDPIDGEGKLARPVMISALRINDAGCVSIPAELFVEIGMEIKRKSLLEKTFVFGYCNGSMGYVISPRIIRMREGEVYGANPKARNVVDREIEASNRIEKAASSLLRKCLQERR